MMANFCKEVFEDASYAEVTMEDGRVINSDFPLSLFQWLKGKNWQSVSLFNSDFGYWVSWDRY